MNRSLPAIPPAPPPIWQTEPIAAKNPMLPDSFVRPGFLWLAIALFMLFGFVFIARVRRMRRSDSKLEEARLRAALAQRIGPDAAWLSAASIARKLAEDRTGPEDPVHDSLRRLAALEAHRFGPASVE